MKRLLLVVAFALLAACGTASEQAKSPAQRVFAVQADYNALLAAAVAYESQPRCTAGQSRIDRCSDPKVVTVMREADDKAFLAIKAAQDTVRTPGATDNTINLAISGASQAIAVLRTVLISYGVTK